MIAALEKDRSHLDFDPYLNINVNAILKRWGYFLGLALGLRAQGWTTFPFT